MVSLIDDNSQDGLTPYAKAVSTFAQICISKQDGFPRNMCFRCLCLLKQAIQFKLVTESSNNCLKKLKNSVGSNSENLKENIIEYTMLKFYFPNESFTKTRECIKEKKDSVNHIMEKDNEVLDIQFNSNTSPDDNIFDTPVLESDTEQNVSHLDVKDTINFENLSGSNMLKSQTPSAVQNVFTRKNKITNRKLLLARQKKRRLKKNLVCNICNRVLANQFTHKYHMQKHYGYRYICEHCGKGYPVFNVLQAHQLLKHSTGPYLQCSHCPFKAPGKIELTEHERIHSGERPYTCDKCGLTFRRRAIWRKHLVQHSEKKFQCPQCPRKFFQRSDMLAHANNIHDRVYVYSCSECGATYTTTKTVRRHMTERHGIPREMQGKILRINKRACEQE
ncbi:jg2045 [Pararge aegeria aegeria]|uniref:Jg2045 protein n=3 Tax=Pararge aegeria TaxID=116150 RepID=A0A8S4R587_9NEOP|nr:jg2045 [Pararge aegeria aegeria]